MPIRQELLDQLKARRAKAQAGGGADKLQARRDKGLMAARDRIAALFDKGTFQESGMHVRHAVRGFGMDNRDLASDGCISGTGYLGGRPLASYSQDFTVAGGSLGSVHAKKITNLMMFAVQNGMPVVAFNDSGGARIQEGVASLAGYGQIFFRNVLLSGVVPQIAVVCGPCAGGAAYSPALMDFVIMTKSTSNMFICGPEVIRAATGEETTMDQVGSAAAHATVSGNIHFVAEDDAHAVALVKELLSYLPSNNMMDPPHQPTDKIAVEPDPAINALVPESHKDPIDVKKVIARLVDGERFLEVQRDWAKSIVVGFGRIEGIVVGIIANQPAVRAGTLDIDSSDKGARFIRFCNAFNIPLVTLVDTPGFMPGIAQERGGIIRHGAKMLFAYSASTVPKVTVIMRKAYGGAYIAMCCQDLGADVVYAWPTAEIAVMGAEGAARIIYKREIESAPDPKAKEAELIADYREKFASPFQAAGSGMIDDVIDPSETRAVVALALRKTLGKRQTRPSKKHGNIPL
ncbi:MAG TPA: acyl-CoA carboxylase subunit beta [Verrucomicrobiae bacterium]|nr:acyl-CoA carboxylase subunit beta [Verrucomicrobiae bacterium]